MAALMESREGQKAALRACFCDGDATTQHAMTRIVTLSNAIPIGVGGSRLEAPLHPGLNAI